MDSELLALLADSLPRIVIPGLTVTLPLAIASFAIALVIAMVMALVQYANIPVLKQVARFYIWVVRGTPLFVQLYIMFFGLPSVGIVLDPLPCAIITLSVNTGAYTAETMRAALESVPSGQLEAGYCVGMSYLQVMRRIVVPQALRTAFPPLSNELISLVKDTSLVSSIMVAEMFRAAQEIASREWVVMPIYLEVAAVYLVFSTVLTWVQRAGERRLAAQGMERG